MALEHIIGVGALAFINEKYIREHFDERWAKLMLDIASFAVVFYGVMADFIGATDPITFTLITLFLEVFLVGVAIAIQEFRLVEKGLQRGFPHKEPKALRL